MLDELPPLVLYNVCLFLDFQTLISMRYVSVGISQIALISLENSNCVISKSFRIHQKLSKIPNNEEFIKNYNEIKNHLGSCLASGCDKYFYWRDTKILTFSSFTGIKYSYVGSLTKQDGYCNLKFAVKLMMNLTNLQRLKKYLFLENSFPIVSSDFLQSPIDCYKDKNLITFFSKYYPYFGVQIDFKKFRLKYFQTNDTNQSLLFPSSNFRRVIYGSPLKGKCCFLTTHFGIIVHNYLNYQFTEHKILQNNKPLLTFNAGIHIDQNTNRFLLLIEPNHDYSMLIVDTKMLNFSYLCCNQSLLCNVAKPRLIFYTVKQYKNNYIPMLIHHDGKIFKYYQLDVTTEPKLVYSSEKGYPSVYCPISKRFISFDSTIPN